MNKRESFLRRKILHPVFFISKRYGGGVGGFIKALREAANVFMKRGPRQFCKQVVNNVLSSKIMSPGLSVSMPITKRGLCFSSIGKPDRHQCSVAIIVCVHNALDDVKNCLASVVQYTFEPYRIIIVDDGSSSETRDYLVEFSSRDSVTLLRNEDASGYTLAANQGLRAATEEYVLLLNSDTVVGRDWLDRMIRCADSSDRIGVVGPLSNTASWQSIPEIEQDGDWAANPLPAGVDTIKMATLVAEKSPCLYPRLSFLNGFCLLIKRQLIEEIGIFDEKTFRRGFCEENDYCLRARLSGWELAVADDVYVYHAQSRSYSNERRRKLAEESYRDFIAKHGTQIVDEGVKQCRFDRAMLGIRARARYLLCNSNLIEKGKTLWGGRRVAFVLPVAVPGGGGNVVIAEALAMAQMGINVTIVNLALNREKFLRGYPNLKVPVSWAINEEQIAGICAEFDAVVATASHSVKWLVPLSLKRESPIISYYIQDYEPYFYESGSAGYNDAVESYSIIPNIVRFTKTKWNQCELEKRLGLASHCIGPSVNNDLFRPYSRYGEGGWLNRPLRVIAMVRPNSPRRGPAMTMRVFKRIKDVFGDKIEITIFGANINDPVLKKLDVDFDFVNLGVLAREKILETMIESDIFVDCSIYQAMGLTAMEAMSCGLAVLLTDKGGVHDFAEHNENCLLVDTSSEEKIYNALYRLIDDDQLRTKLQIKAIEDMAKYDSIRSAYNILNILFKRSSDEHN